MMKRKIAGVIVCMLLIFAAVFSVAGIMIIDQTEEFLSLSSYNFSNGTYSITWDATLNFSETGGAADNAIFGEAPDACDGPTGSGPCGDDDYDKQKAPASPPPSIRAWFNDGLDEPFNCMHADYRQGPDTSKVWNLSVQWLPTDYVSPTDVTISWDVDDLDGSEYDTVVLYDVIGGNVVADILNPVDPFYTFTASAMTPKSFQIICSINEPPGFSDENPSDESVDVPITTSQLTVIIENPDGDTFDWTIETIPDIGISDGVGESNGTKICSVSGLSYSTTYTWYVNATDSGSKTTNEEVYTFTTESSPNNHPYVPTGPDPENGSIDVSINTNLSWIGGDPDVEDNVTYDIYFGICPETPKVASNQSDPTYEPGLLNYETHYCWKIVTWDNHEASTAGPIWDFTTEMEPEPDLDCDGELRWVDVEPGLTVIGDFKVKNVGDASSELDWEITEWPSWGTFAFNPIMSTGLPAGSWENVQVTVVAPDEQNQDFTGEVKIVNLDDPTDNCTIDVSLATPVSQNSFILQFLERLIHRFPLLERILSSCPFLDRILSLK